MYSINGAGYFYRIGECPRYENQVEPTIEKATLIAIYNACSLKKLENVSLSKIIYLCELGGYAALTGQWGTNPYRIGKLITMCGLNYKALGSPRKLQMENLKIY